MSLYYYALGTIKLSFSTGKMLMSADQAPEEKDMSKDIADLKSMVLEGFKSLGSVTSGMKSLESKVDSVQSSLIGLENNVGIMAKDVDEIKKGNIELRLDVGDLKKDTQYINKELSKKATDQGLENVKIKLEGELNTSTKGLDGKITAVETATKEIQEQRLRNTIAPGQLAVGLITGLAIAIFSGFLLPLWKNSVPGKNNPAQSTTQDSPVKTVQNK
jgi:chromosome segregation ATPase